MATLFNEYVFLLFIYFKCTSSFFFFCNLSVKPAPRFSRSYVHISYFNISVAVHPPLADRGRLYLLPFFNFLIKMFWFISSCATIIMVEGNTPVFFPQQFDFNVFTCSFTSSCRHRRLYKLSDVWSSPLILFNLPDRWFIHRLNI